MHLVYLTDIFEDNYNIARDHFETDSVNVMKKGRLFQRNKGNFNIYSLGSILTENHENCHHEQQHLKRS